MYKDKFGLGRAVVLNMLDELEKAYPKVRFSMYFDNYFTSIKLLEEINKRGHGAAGTIRSNRIEKCPMKSTKVFEKSARGTVEYHCN